MLQKVIDLFVKFFGVKRKKPQEEASSDDIYPMW